MTPDKRDDELVKNIIANLDACRYEVSLPEGLRDPSLCGWPLSLLLEAIEQAGYTVVPTADLELIKSTVDQIYDEQTKTLALISAVFPQKPKKGTYPA